MTDLALTEHQHLNLYDLENAGVEPRGPFYLSPAKMVFANRARS